MIDRNQVRRLVENGDLCCTTLIDLCDALDEARAERDQVHQVNRSLAVQIHESLLRAEKAELDARNYKHERDAALAAEDNYIARCQKAEAAIERVQGLCEAAYAVQDTLNPHEIAAALNGSA